MSITGWATDLKTVPADMVDRRVWRTGDGSHKNANKEQDSLKHTSNYRDVSHFWGFGDKEMTEEDMQRVKFIR